ncbi:MAG: copper amine oxidase N-terminal domain-containing protein [Syntrophomonadaceae bacterium]|jgi:hypothetical protein|nr:copper amine oxidase N-terminal domain-containing protein [Syntrophomonadaceae bacterium]MDH7496823.1 copper amine oxidase N-terminal domain-containing protein [Syntrophomonadaceae bacterium]
MSNPLRTNQVEKCRRRVRMSLPAFLLAGLMALLMSGCAPRPAPQPSLPRETGLEVRAASPLQVYTGRLDAGVAAVEVRELGAGSLEEGRTVTLELPPGLAWNRAPVPTVIEGDVVLGSGAIPEDSQGRLVSYTVLKAGNRASRVVFERGAVTVPLGTGEGEVILTVGGTAGASAQVPVARVARALSLEVGGTRTVGAGRQAQPAADLVVREAGPEALQAVVRGTQGRLVVVAPTGVTFAARPTVNVTAGDLELASPSAMVSGNILTILLRGGSTQPSTIAVSDILLTLDRTVPAGPVMLAVGGSAVDAITMGNPFVSAAEAAVAYCNTAPPKGTQIVSSFTIGGTTMKVDGEERPMAFAPFLREGKVFVAVSDVAQMLGVSAGDVHWDAATRTVSMLTPAKALQISIGSRTMRVNGVEVPMEAAAELVSGRVLVPAADVCRAFAAQFAFDPSSGKCSVDS